MCVAFLAVSCGGPNPDAPAASGSSGASASNSLKVIPHERLLEILPALEGWTKAREPQGSTDNEEKVSRVQVDYEPTGPDKASQIGIEIMDTTKNPNILAPLTDFIRKNREEKLAGVGTTTPIEVAGFKGMQEWTPEAKNGTLSLLVADRYTVGITANSISGPEVMRKVAEAMDLRKLASLK